MSEYKQDFEKNKNNVLELLERSRAFCEAAGSLERAETFGSLAETLRKGEFSIVVVGEFSAGKSTFLNALMGERLLPSFTKETTATVNFLKHKDNARDGEIGVVYYSDGNKERIDADGSNLTDIVKKYASTAGKEMGINVAEKIEHFDLFLDSKFLKDGVMLVDSPGLNGIADMHREITERQIERSSACIFMFRADQPGSKSDFEFLRELKDKVKTIIFVLNKIDEIKETEGETVDSVINQIKTNYKSQFPNDTTMPEIIGISAYKALVARSKQRLDYPQGVFDHTPEQKEELLEQSGMAAFEKRLWKFLTMGEKGHKMRLEPVERTVGLLNAEKQQMEAEIGDLEEKTDEQEIIAQIEEIKKQENGIEKQMEERKKEIKNKLTEVEREAKESISDKIHDFKQQMITEFNNIETLNEYEIYMETINGRVDSRISRIIKDAESEFVGGINDIVDSNYGDISLEVNEHLQSLNIRGMMPQKFEITNISFDKSMEEYEKKKEELTQERDKLKEESDKVYEAAWKAKSNQMQLQKLEERLERLESEKNIFEKIYTPPARVYRDERRVVYEDRRGIFGKIAEVCVGKKRMEVTESKDNQEEIDEYREIYNAAMNEKKELIARERQNLDKLPKGNMAPEFYEKQKSELDNKINTYDKELDELSKNLWNDIKKKQSAFIMNQKLKISDDFDERESEINRNISAELRKSKDAIVGIVCSAVLGKMKSELDELSGKKEALITKKRQSEQGIRERIETLNEYIEKINEILRDAVKLQSEIENEEIDVIGQAI